MLNPGRHGDGRIGLADTGLSPSCSIKSPELLSYTSGVSGEEDRSDAPALKAHEIQNLTSSTPNIHSSLLGSYK